MSILEYQTYKCEEDYEEEPYKSDIGMIAMSPDVEVKPTVEHKPTVLPKQVSSTFPDKIYKGKGVSSRLLVISYES